MLSILNSHFPPSVVAIEIVNEMAGRDPRFGARRRVGFHDLKNSRARADVHRVWGELALHAFAGQRSDHAACIDLDVQMNVLIDVSQHMSLNGVVKGNVFAQVLMHFVPWSAYVGSQEPTHRSKVFVEPLTSASPTPQHRLAARVTRRQRLIAHICDSLFCVKGCATQPWVFRRSPSPCRNALRTILCRPIEKQLSDEPRHSVQWMLE